MGLASQTHPGWPAPPCSFVSSASQQLVQLCVAKPRLTLTGLSTSECKCPDLVCCCRCCLKHFCCLCHMCTSALSWARIVVCCAALYCTLLYCTVLYCTVLYCTVLYCAVLCCAGPYRAVPYRTGLYCTGLYRTVMTSYPVAQS